MAIRELLLVVRLLELRHWWLHILDHLLRRHFSSEVELPLRHVIISIGVHDRSLWLETKGLRLWGLRVKLSCLLGKSLLVVELLLGLGQIGTRDARVHHLARLSQHYIFGFDVNFYWMICFYPLTRVVGHSGYWFGRIQSSLVGRWFLGYLLVVNRNIIGHLGPFVHKLAHFL